MKKNNEKTLSWLLDQRLDRIRNVCDFVNKESKYKIKVTGGKKELIGHLSNVSYDVTCRAIESVFRDSYHDELGSEDCFQGSSIENNVVCGEENIIQRRGIFKNLERIFNENNNSEITWLTYNFYPDRNLLSLLKKSNCKVNFFCNHPKNINSGNPITRESLEKINLSTHTIDGIVSLDTQGGAGNLHLKVILIEKNNNTRVFLTSANCTYNSLFNYCEFFIEITNEDEREKIINEVNELLKHQHPIDVEDIEPDESESEPEYEIPSPELLHQRYLEIRRVFDPNRMFLNESYNKLMSNNWKVENKAVIAAPPGVGKTMQAACYTYKEFILKNKRTLWITFNGELLFQALETFFRLGLSPCKIDHYGSTAELSKLRKKSEHQLLTLITIQTLYSQFKSGVHILKDLLPEIVIIDEHWGIDQQSYKHLQKFCDKHNITVILLSATPKKDSWFSGKNCIKNSFVVTKKEAEDSKLVAIPEFYSPDTGTIWHPKKTNKNLIPEFYFNQLSQSDERNKFILKTFLDKNRKYFETKTLIFACNLEHAKVLNKLFGKHCKSSTYDSNNSQAVNLENLTKFKENEIDVLITVNKFLFGIHVPDIKTIFMTRPTESVDLFIQMTGRGASKTAGKNTYNVVEFTDNCRNHEIKFIDHNYTGVWL